MTRPTALAALLLTVLALAPKSAQAQSLRDRFLDLFTFGNCGEALCLPVPTSHEHHFIPEVVAGRSDLLGFLGSAIGTSIANVPIGSTSGGVTFTFAGGLPQETSVSGGPILGERAPTLGRGRLLFGASVIGEKFQSIRGVPMNHVVFDFTHQNVGDSILGIPHFEDDIFEVRTSLDVSMLATTIFATYGLFDRMDISVAVPLVRTSLSGTSVAQIYPAEDTTPHYFGTAANPSLTSTSSTAGSAFGVGDVATRLKLLLLQSPQHSLAVLADVRLPTGDEANLLGAGATTVRGLLIGSARVGAVTPHADLGYIHRGGDSPYRAVQAILGFDQLMTPSITLAADLLTEWETGPRPPLPGPVTLQSPYVRVVQPTNIPDTRDNLMDGSFGFKVRASSGLNLVANALVPLNRGGVRPDVLWTLGVELSQYPGAGRRPGEALRH